VIWTPFTPSLFGLAPPPPPTEEELFDRKSLAELNSEQPLGNVSFDYDSAELSDAARDTLQGNSEWLQRWTSTGIMVEGHCDERGTNEYNLGLGEQRARAVVDYLTSLGVDAGRLSMVSKGEEEPTCTEETEACWAQNRRGHFIITAK